MRRLPVIQYLAEEVKQTTQSLLAQILQRLRSSIQVRRSEFVRPQKTSFDNGSLRIPQELDGTFRINTSE